MEKALAEDLESAGYTVLNTVKWSHEYDSEVWSSVGDLMGTGFNGDSYL
jgi:hypothetical protein